MDDKIIEVLGYKIKYWEKQGENYRLSFDDIKKIKKELELGYVEGWIEISKDLKVYWTIIGDISIE